MNKPEINPASVPVALFVGAHPDDIEIGAGGTVAKLAGSGWDVWYCVLTSESDIAVAQARKMEAQNAAHTLGIKPDRVILLDLPDARLEATGETVAQLREVLENRKVDPDIVFTHTLADSHNDHRAVHNIVLATFRKKPILSFAVVNSLIRSEFRPKVFAEIGPYRNVKREALMRHVSQSTRINEEAIENINKVFSADLSLDETEPFEVILQEGAEDLLYLVLSLNDCPFHNFWYPLLREQPLVVIHSVPIYRKTIHYGWTANKEQEGIELLYETFSRMWHDRHPVTSKSSVNPSANGYLQTSNILLCGSSASNQFINNHFNNFKGIRYITGHSMPDYTNLAINDLVSSKKITAHYEKDDSGNYIVTKDFGILTVMRNPVRETRSLIGCMGIHGFGTFGCLRAICERGLLKELLPFLDFPLLSKGIQVLIEYDILNNVIGIDRKSLHIITP
ncbi:MAG: PIG-L family deacetylase [Syntrophorhabdaceae bacterium]|nr:PIG-L family deacetylase [Syntrophorhabdaceae bacterium]